MQERQVTIADETFKLDYPFLVMATQNPIEQEGVYALPEAQLDRFMMKLVVEHNSAEDELEIMRKGASKSFGEVQKVLSLEELQEMQDALGEIHIDEALEQYIVDLISATRDPAKFALEGIAEDIMFGVSPRASIDLYKAAKAKAFLRGNDFVTPADIGYVIHDVLRHRIVLSYEARAKGVSTDDIISKIVETVPIP
jgi:MoxR-like ATPase